MSGLPVRMPSKDFEDFSVTARLVSGTIALKGRKGTVWFTVAMPLPPTTETSPGDHPWDKWVGAKLEADSSEQAHNFVGELAEWLGVEMPSPTGNQVHVSYNWDIHKLTLEDDDDHAEIYLNLGADARTPRDLFGNLGFPHIAALRQKDEGYASSIVRLVLDALMERIYADA